MKYLFILLLLPCLSFGQANPQGRYIVTSGSTYLIPDDAFMVSVNPASVIASHTMTLPANPSDRQVIRVYFGGTIANQGSVVTSLTINPNTGQTILQGSSPVAAYSGDYLNYVFDAGLSVWRKNSGVMQSTLKNFVSYSTISYNNTPSITLNSASIISSTLNTRVNYTLSVASSVTIGQGIAYLEISSDNVTWKTISQSGETSIALLNTKYYNIQGEVPINYYRRIRTSVTGGATVTFITGQEVSY